LAAVPYRLISAPKMALIGFQRHKCVLMINKRPRIKQTVSLEKRLIQEAKLQREEAERLPPGPAREEALRRAIQAESAVHVSEWLTSPGPKPPV
jgi:hypothetical protein